MPEPTPTRPLWEAMHCAWSPHREPGNWRLGYAAELRAIADWLVPLEQPPHRGMRPGGSTLTYQETLSVERQRLRATLLAEADRAEAEVAGTVSFDTEDGVVELEASQIEFIPPPQGPSTTGGGAMADHDNIIITGGSASGFRTGSTTPAAYRLVRRGGELLLQGRFDWIDGKQAGFDWRDIPTVVEESPAANSTPNRPLWEVMEDAHREEAGCVFDHLGNTVLSEPDRFTRAAELRAIAEWIKQREQQSSVVAEVIDVSKWLHEEADRAETGE
jgi:hypothetical protein